jgi:hypothetical protein
MNTSVGLGRAPGRARHRRVDHRRPVRGQRGGGGSVSQGSADEVSSSSAPGRTPVHHAGIAQHHLLHHAGHWAAW